MNEITNQIKQELELIQETRDAVKNNIVKYCQTRRATFHTINSDFGMKNAIIHSLLTELVSDGRLKCEKVGTVKFYCVSDK